MPQLSLQGQTFQQNNASSRSIPAATAYQVVAQLSVPLYQGGAEYSAVRQARQQEQQTRKQLDDARRAAIQQATQAWETLVAARATAESTRPRSAPTRSRWKAWSARRSSAAAPRWTC